MIHQYPADFSCSLPDSFTDPFRYTPHPLVIQAGDLLTHRIRSSSALSAIFAEGKMLGVLAVAHGEGLKEIGYLAAFSGNVGGMNTIEGFVPPIYDLLDPDGYFKTKEAEISTLNADIASAETGADLASIRMELTKAETSMAEEISKQKARMAILKAERDQIRSEVLEDTRSNELIRQSQHEKAELKRIKAYWDGVISGLKGRLDEQMERIHEMKRRR